MPAPGDQHKAWANPFEDVKPRISEWTAKDIATISSRLDKQLGPEYISSRAGPGGSRVHYLTAEKCIGLANEVFGFNGWSSSIQNIQVDFADENPQTQRVSIGLSVIVRITLRDGTYHEDVGYGSIENAKSKAMGFEKAKKEGTTDAMKRTLRNFGNVLGNCIYDQDYVKQVTKLKAHPVKKFDQDNLHRHSDFMRKDLTKIEPIGNTNANRNTVGNGSGNTSITAPSGGVKPEPIDSFEDFLGELDEADFCVPEDGHPDEIILPTINNTSNTNDRLAINAPSHMQQPAGQAARPIPANQTKQTPHTPRQGPIGPNVQHDSQAAPPGRPQPAAHPRDASNNATATFQPPPAQQGGNPSEPVAFFSARSVASASDQPGQGNNQSGPKQLFNPKAESPSIRKTPGIDHTSSKPLSRSGQHVAPPSSQSSGAQPAITSNSTPLRQSVSSSQLGRGNVLNPSLDHARRIGVPGGPGSPLSNRNSYRPPTMKRPLGGEATGPNGSRTPLADIQSNANGNAASGSTNGPLDAKRQKTT